MTEASHDERALKTLARVLRGTLLVVPAAFVVVLLVTSLGWRVPFPYELEWMEGGAVCHVWRLHQGQPLYAPPSIDFVPFLYTPLYFYVGAALTKVTGLGLAPLRLLSLASAVGAAVLIGLVARRRAGSPFAGILAGGLFLASFAATGAWLDLVRVDSLFLLLLAGALLCFGDRRPAVHALLCPVLLFAAYFTKQTTLLVAVPLMLWTVIFRRGWQRLAFPALFVALAAGSTWTMNAATDGWYSYYVFELPRQHGLRGPMIESYWVQDIVWQAGLALALASVPLLRRVARRDWPGLGADAAILGGLLVVSWIGRIHTGGYKNVLLPAFAGLSIYFGVGVVEALAGARPLARNAILLAALLQFGALFYWPGVRVPPAEARAAGDDLLALLAGIDGDVYMPDHPWYLVLAGKPPVAHQMGMKDVYRGADGSEEATALGQSVLEALQQRRFAAAIVDDREEFPVPSRAMRRNYRRVPGELAFEALTPPTGTRLYPRYQYVVRKPAGVPRETVNARGE